MDCMNLVIPPETANAKLPDPSLLNYYQMSEERVLWLDGEVTEYSTELVKKIMLWNMEDNDKDIPVEMRKPIKLMLLSPGGDIYVMLAIVDAIRLSKTPVWTCSVSFAASAACAILLAGHKRFCFPMSHAMWHSGSAGLAGSMEQVQSASKHLDCIEAQMSKFLLERAKISPRLLKKQKDKDWYFDAQEMLEYGIVDRIVESFDEII